MRRGGPAGEGRGVLEESGGEKIVRGGLSSGVRLHVRNFE